MTGPRKFLTTRRRLLAAGAAGAASLALPALVRAQDKTLKVGAYGGFFKNTFDEHIYPDFTKATGIKVDSIAEPTGEAWLVQLRNAARAGQAPADVSMIAQTPRLKGARAKLWSRMDPARLENSKYLYDHFVNKDDEGHIIGIGAVSWYITLVTNTKAYPNAPTSWQAIWDPANKNKVGLLALPSNSFLLEITAQTYFKGHDSLKGKDDILKVLQKLTELKPNVRLWYRDEAQFQQELQSGEIPMGQYYHDVTGLAAKKGFPVRSTFPKEGAVLDSGSWAVTTASKKLEQAQVFINYMCQPEIQDKVARTLGSAPTVQRKFLNLSDAEFAAVASDIPPILPKYDMYLDLGDWISDRWTAMLVS